MEPVRLGLIGCGVIGQFHLRAAKGWPATRFVAVADPRAEAASLTASSFGIETVYPDGQALIRDVNVEAVVLALPTGLRKPLALAALAAGKHVLLEKPAAMSVGDLLEMRAVAHGCVIASCSSRHRFLKSAKVAADFIATGALGRLRVVRCRAVGPAGKPPQSPPPVWRLSRSLNGGGIFVNWGSYDLDYLLGLTGWALRPRTVMAQAWPIAPHLSSRAAPGSDAETHVAALVRCDEDIVLIYERGEFTSTASDAAWQIIGEKGSLRLHMLPGENVVILHDEATDELGVTSRELWRGSETWESIHEGPVRDFADAIRSGRPPCTGMDQALLIQRITDAVYESARSGRAVDIA